MSKFLDAVFENDRDLVDGALCDKLFHLYLKHDKDNLLNFLLRANRYPSDAEQLFQENELYIE